ncbi:MAG: hypothetical protein OJF49_000352 [Ktedonobacterales bacterium]|jgi:tetratricopeptide (TPR) repeat protein|nr:MAG: hypothetical protein OJF49_000352 [Ktedonobacterales bacterium]
MDAVRFGRWLSERRRECGWPSQRALVHAATYDIHTGNQGISAAFMARLEAGLLAHPFRGGVRQRVLALAWLLCKTPQQVRSYLRLSELTDLTSEEADQVNQLQRALAAPHRPAPFLLPLRPPQLVGRNEILDNLVHMLTTVESGCYVLTGMPGAGKSALAAEAMHVVLARHREQHAHLFPDGIVTFTCVGRIGEDGLLSLLQDIITMFDSSQDATTRGKSLLHRGGTQTLDATLTTVAWLRTSDGAFDGRTLASHDLAHTIDHVRAVLMDKRMLLLLDGLEPRFPLSQALEALTIGGAHVVTGVESHAKHVVLATSRYIPRAPISTHCIHVPPLETPDAVALFTSLVGQELSEDAQILATQLCAALGGLPLAVEAAASAIRTRGVSLSLLTRQVNHHPFDALLDDDGALHATLVQALEPLDPESRRRFALLSLIGDHSFEVEVAAALHDTPPALPQLPLGGNASAGVSRGAAEPLAILDMPGTAPLWEIGEEPETLTAQTSAILGQLLRHSLLEVIPGDNRSVGQSSELAPGQPPGTHFRLHPLLRAYAAECAQHLEPATLYMAQQGLCSYALAYLERYNDNIPALAAKSALLRLALWHVWHAGQHALVVRLVATLSSFGMPSLGYVEDERTLLCGVHASTTLGDHFHLIEFLNRLGTVRYYQDDLLGARSAWEEGLDIVEQSEYQSSYPTPLYNLIELAQHEGDYDAAWRFAERAVEESRARGDDVRDMAQALLKRGACARLRGDNATAFKDLTRCVRLLTDKANNKSAHRNDTLWLEAQIQLARVQGDFSLSQSYVEQMAETVRNSTCQFTSAEILLEQAEYAYEIGLCDVACALAERALDTVRECDARSLRRRGIFLLKRMRELPHPLKRHA